MDTENIIGNDLINVAWNRIDNYNVDLIEAVSKLIGSEFFDGWNQSLRNELHFTFVTALIKRKKVFLIIQLWA